MAYEYDRPDDLSRRTFLTTGACVIGAMAVGCTRPPRSDRAPGNGGAEPEPPVTLGLEQPSLSLGAAPEVRPTDALPDGGGAAATRADRPDRPLLARFPALATAIPWMDLGGLPTEVSPAEALGARLGLPGLHVKRDDRAGDVYGGSKARKLEVLLAEALEQGAPSVLTFGGVGSNHALGTAVHARRLGLDCVLALLPERPSAHAREHLLAERGLGCEQFPAGGTDLEAAARVIRLRGAGTEPPYVIPVGGTSALGNLGYVNAAFELAGQCEAGLLPEPDVIYVAAGTLGTAAGLHVGLRAAGLPTRLVAVRASNPGTGSMANLRAEIARTVSFLQRIDPSFPEPAPGLLHLEHGFAGPGYAIPTADGDRASELARVLAGLELDPTYTAKAFAALAAHAPGLSGQRVLFWNTFDPRHVPTGTVTPADLPLAFRRYFRAPSR